MYATITDMQDRFERQELIQLTDQNGMGVIDEAAVNKALADANDEINSYIGKLYLVPVVPTTPSLVRYSCFIARYLLWSMKAEMPEIVKANYQAAITWLKAVAKGEATLEAQGVTAAAQDASGILMGESAAGSARKKYGGF